MVLSLCGEETFLLWNKEKVRSAAKTEQKTLDKTELTDLSEGYLFIPDDYFDFSSLLVFFKITFSSSTSFF